MNKKLLKQFLPQIVLDIYRHFNTKKANLEYGWFGNYNSWQEALMYCDGYDSDTILNKCRDALLKLINGEAAYERDSVLFDDIQYSWPVLASLLKIATECDNILNIIDFGGSLGSSYHQNRKILGDAIKISWNIVEQEKFVKCGKDNFESSELKFFYNIKSVVNECNPNIFFASSSLQYVENPYDILKQIMNYKIMYLVFDRMYFVDSAMDILTIQRVNPGIYDASYPCWFFSKNKFIEFLKNEYELIVEFNSYLTTIEEYEGKKVHDKGFLMKKRNNIIQD